MVSFDVEYDKALESCLVYNQFDHDTTNCTVGKTWVERVHARRDPPA